MSKICPSCGNKNGNKDLFCKKCGADIASVSKNKRNSKTIILIITISIIAIACAFLFVKFYLVSPINKLEKAIDANNENDVVSVYTKEIKGKGKYNDDLSKLVENKLSNIKDDYISGNIKYDEAKVKLNILINIDEAQGDIDIVATKLEKINDVRFLIESAKNDIQNQQYIDAFNKLWSIDADNDIDEYDEVNQLLKDYENQYVDQVLSKAQARMEGKNFIGAKKILQEAKEKIKNVDIDKMIDQVEVAKDKEAENLYKNQIAKVVSVQAIKSSNNDTLLTFEVKNQNPSKVIRSYIIEFVIKDKSGNILPIKESNGTSGDFICSWEIESIPPYSVGGSAGSALHILNNADEIAYVYACVTEFTYSDGTACSNEYFDYWKDNIGLSE